MTQAIIFTNDAGGVSVCVPTGEISIDAVLDKDVPKNRNARIVSITELPKQYNDFFDAWELTDAAIIINKAKAVEITKNRLRSEREPLLAAQDVAFQRALEEGKDTSSIVAEKQRLRDITKLATQDKTLEELRAITEWLRFLSLLDRIISFILKNTKVFRSCTVMCITGVQQCLKH